VARDGTRSNLLYLLRRTLFFRSKKCFGPALQWLDTRANAFQTWACEGARPAWWENSWATAREPGADGLGIAEAYVANHWHRAGWQQLVV